MFANQNKLMLFVFYVRVLFCAFNLWLNTVLVLSWTDAETGTKKLKSTMFVIDNSDSNNETQTINVELQQFNLYNNKYRLIEEIANGAFATVFRVEEISTKKMLLKFF